jgi:hypothetical protein
MPYVSAATLTKLQTLRWSTATPVGLPSAPVR